MASAVSSKVASVSFAKLDNLADDSCCCRVFPLYNAIFESPYWTPANYRDPRWGPFCSERCQLLDLAHWLDGTYRVEGPADGTPREMEPDDPEATDQ